MGRHANNNFVITPHKRRGPIAAEFQSPGPAAINLPGLFGSKYALTYKNLCFLSTAPCKTVSSTIPNLEKQYYQITPNIANSST